MYVLSSRIPAYVRSRGVRMFEITWMDDIGRAHGWAASGASAIGMRDRKGRAVRHCEREETRKARGREFELQ